MISILQSLPTNIKETTAIDSSSYRIFQIYDTKTKKLIISWPTTTNASNNLFIKNGTELANMITIREIDQHLLNNTQQQATAACTHHCHSNSNLIIEPYGLCRVERIIITYGNLTFSSFQLTPLNLLSLLSKEQSSSSCSSYHHYMYCSSAANNNSSSRSSPSSTGLEDNRLRRKSNINDILNSSNTTMDHHGNSHISPMNYHSNDTTLSPSSSPYILPPPSSSYFNHRHHNSPSSLKSHHHTSSSTTSSTSTSSNIPIRYTDNIIRDVPTNENRHSVPIAATATSPTTTTKSSSPNLPRAWRGRFGAYEKKCENCQTNSSPEWRRGPSGHKT